MESDWHGSDNRSLAGSQIPDRQPPRVVAPEIAQRRTKLRDRRRRTNKKAARRALKKLLNSVWPEQFKRGNRDKLRLCGALCTHLRRPLPDWIVMPFGKYEGRPLRAVVADYKYCDWLLGETWFRERFGDLAEALRTQRKLRHRREYIDRHGRLVLPMERGSSLRGGSTVIRIGGA